MKATNHHKMIKSKLWAFLLIFTMCAWLWPWNLMEVQAATATELKKPRVTVNSSGDVEKATWDCVWFGNYKQSSDGNGGFKREPIKWRVLSVNGNDAFLIADQNLDCKKYNETNKDVTWEECTLRSWLNGYDGTKNTDGKNYSSDNFINEVFSSDEQKVIRATTVVNEDNPFHGTEGGNDTTDQIYLLSIKEAGKTTYGFSSGYGVHDVGRHAKNTDYAKSQGAYTDASTGYAGNGWWWLRSPGSNSNDAASVDYYGRLADDYVSNGRRTVRPALHLNLESNLWSHAGTVSSDGVVNEKTPTYKISYDANGGTGAPSAQTKTHDQALTLSGTVPTREGYDFLGWSENRTASTATYTARGSYTSNSSATLYAVWKLKEYTVSYHANGGTGAPSPQIKYYGKTLTLSSAKPTRTGYDFQGWATSSGASVARYAAGGSYTNNCDVTLYAVWKSRSKVSDNQNQDSDSSNEKWTQTIYASSKTLTYKGKSVSLNAETDGDGKLSYSSSNKKVVTVSSSGTLKPKACGTASITIKAAATGTYKAAKKTIKVKVTLKKPTLRGKWIGSSSVKLSWSKVPGASGYKVYSCNTNQRKYRCVITKKAKQRSATHRNVKKGIVYLYKVRAYRKVGKKIVYSPYSQVGRAWWAY